MRHFFCLRPVSPECDLAGNACVERKRAGGRVPQRIGADRAGG